MRKATRAHKISKFWQLLFTITLLIVWMVGVGAGTSDARESSDATTSPNTAKDGPVHKVIAAPGLLDPSAEGVTLWLAALNPEPLKVIRNSPLGKIMGNERMFFNLEQAVETFLGHELEKE